MPPKKKEVEEKPALIGRLGTNLKCGIVGLPNVGKSTFFNVLTKSSAAASNFPFCTIDPNESKVPVPDARYDFLVKFWSPSSKVSAFLNVVDIAGLVKGASEGQGLGNAFLSHIKACDALFHMSRAFEDSDVTHVDGDVDPIRDLGTILDELRFKDMEYINKQVETAQKNAVRSGGSSGDKKVVAELKTLQKIQQLLESGKHVRFQHWNTAEIEILNQHLLITSKPMIYLVNLSEKDYIRKKNKWLAKIKAWIDEHDPGASLIPFSGVFELKLLDMSDEERKAYLEETKVTCALEKIIKTGYSALQLEYFFTTGKDEVKAWTILKGTKAPQAAGRIHTDFEKGFIMAETMKFVDFKEHGTELACKAAGKYHQKGKEYVVQDGDIIFFKFNAGAGLSDKKKK